MTKSPLFRVLLLLMLGSLVHQAVAQDEETDSALDYRTSGNSKFTNGDLKGAIADYNEAISLQPRFTKAYVDRAKAKNAAGDIDGALKDYNQAIALDPKNPQHFIDRGILRQNSGDLRGALDDYNQSIRLDPANPVGYNNTAWILSTASDSSIRNGPKAIELATKACELSHWKISVLYGTLAAAYAESGDFDQAVSYQSEYLNNNPDSKDGASRLALYKNHLPCHETGKDFKL